jgi:hypothetical protein
MIRRVVFVVVSALTGLLLATAPAGAATCFHILQWKHCL